MNSREATSINSTSDPFQAIGVGMVGLGMIFDETYRPFFESASCTPLFSPEIGPVEVNLRAAATRTGIRTKKFVSCLPNHQQTAFRNCHGPSAMAELLASDIQVVCIATPDDRHFEPARAALKSGKHVLIEKPSVLSLSELDELLAISRENDRLVKVVYHKLLDPDHKRLRTLVVDGVLKHVNNGYCSLLEPKQIASGQFSEWIPGRNPGTYVAVHYFKLIDFTFGAEWSLARISATGQRGIIGHANGSTWDSVQLQVVYRHQDSREAAFDIHTSWVTPDNFPGYVEQEVQFRFDNAVWNAHQRKRGVEVTIENRSPGEFRYTPNHHYNGCFLEPWGERTQRGYGIEAIERFFREVAFVEFGGSASSRPARLEKMRALAYNDLSADRNCVAIVQSLEAILAEAVAGYLGCSVQVNGPKAGLVLNRPGVADSVVLYEGRV